MITTPLPWELDSEDFSESDHVRSPGLHLGRILAELDQARGKTYPPSSPATKQLYFAMGFVWERIISEVLLETAVRKAAGDLVRPGEFTVEGVAMTPDAVDIPGYTLEEYKATYLSSSHEIDSDKFWVWFVQMKCYCKALGTRKARLRVWFIVGDWKGSGPQTKAWEFEFTEREIEEAWSMVLNHAKARGWL